jgi:hypothetical protein
MESFSERHGYSSIEPEISIREGAPPVLRGAIVSAARHAGMDPNTLRRVVTQTLAIAADERGNWSEPNILREVEDALNGCEWFEVYDVIEALAEALSRWPRHPLAQGTPSEVFSHDINRVFRKNGIGWQLAANRVEMRGSDVFEMAVRQGRDELSQAGKTTTASELHEALRDLSRRPTPELSGAVQHGLAALECLARDLTGSKHTLGDLIKKQPELFPRPLDIAVSKVYGYASENGRHLIEGREPTFEEAELLVGLSGVLCRYLGRKLPRKGELAHAAAAFPLGQPGNWSR